MQPYKKNISLTLLFLSLFSFFQIKIVSAARETGGLVPCAGDSDPLNACNLCYLFEGISNIINWGRDILVVVAVVAIVAGAIMYIVSAGNSGLMESAKSVIKQALWGTVIVLGAWVIVNTALWLGVSKIYEGGPGDDVLDIKTWYNFDCKGGGSRTGSGAGTGSTTTPPPSGTTTPPTNSQTEADARANLTAASGGKITFWESKAGATNIKDLKKSSVDGVMAFQKEVGVPIIVTAGADTGTVHSNSTDPNAQSHANGYKVDINRDPAVTSYIENKYKPIGKRENDSAPLYQDPKGNIYAKEDSHWDVTYLPT